MHELPNQTYFPIKGVPTYRHIKPTYVLPLPLVFPLSFFLPRAFIEDQTNSRYLHPLGLSSHSTAVLWYRRAGKGTRLSLSGSLREHCFHLDRYLSSNVPQERPSSPLGDWCTEGDKGDMAGSPERLYHKFKMLIYFVSVSFCLSACALMKALCGVTLLLTCNCLVAALYTLTVLLSQGSRLCQDFLQCFYSGGIPPYLKWRAPAIFLLNIILSLVSFWKSKQWCFITQQRPHAEVWKVSSVFGDVCGRD